MNGSKSPTGKMHLTQLDGLKGVICFFIVFVHYYNRTSSGVFPFSWMPELLVQKGWMYVELFFIISGFLTAYSYKHKIDTISFDQFFAGRFKRLYPSVVLVTILDAAVRVVGVFATKTAYRLSVTNLIKSLTFASTLIYNEEPFPTVLWYVHVLFVCWLLWYFAARAKTDTGYLAGTAGMLVLGLVLCQAELDFPFLYRNIGRGYLSFSIGLLLFEFQQRADWRCKKATTLTMLFVSAVSFLLGLAFTFETVYGDIWFVFTVLLFPTVVLCLLNLPLFAAIFSVKPLVWLGKRSMAIFLVHVPLLNLFNILNGMTGLFPLESKAVFAFVMLCIVAAASLWHSLIEKKLIPCVLKRI